jgi:hypothetical protein
MKTERRPERLPKTSGQGAWKWWLAAIVILLGGIVIGSAGTLAVVRRAVTMHHRRTPEQTAERVVDRMERELALSPEQKDVVRAVVTRRMKALREIREEVVPRVTEQLEAARGEIDAVLDPDQQRKWHAHFRRLERLMRPVRMGTGPEDRRKPGSRSTP